MIIGSVAFIFALAQGQELPKLAQLRPGEVLRVLERTMSRRGTFENVLVLTSSKAFIKEGDARHSMVLNPSQQSLLKAILAKEPVGLRAKKRPNPMWPSAYDASDMWITYRIGRTMKRWGNNDYEYPTSNCPLIKLFEEIKTQMAAMPNQ